MVQKSLKTVPQGDFLSIQDLFYLCLSRWKWFVLSLVLCVGVAVVYILHTQPVYSRTASLLIKDNSDGKSVSSDIESFSQLGLFQSNTNVNNELISISSPAVMTEVVKRLHLEISYYIPGKFHKLTAYGLSLPVSVTFFDSPENESSEFVMDIGPEGVARLSAFKLKGKKLDAEDVEGRLGDEIDTPVGKLRIVPENNYREGKPYTIHLVRSSIYSATRAYSSNLTVALNGEKSSVVDLTFKDYSVQRAEDVLNTLISVYNENWVKDKNQIAINTSMFINDRLAVIEQELGNVDEDISSYKSEHLLPDVQAASNLYMTQSSETNARIMALNNQLYMTRYIRNYLSNDSNKTQLLPANSGIDNSNIESQIGEYNKQLLQRNSLVANSSTENPLVVDMDQALAAMRSAIVRSIDNQMVTLNEQLKSLQRTELQTTSRIAANPSQAKYLLSVERQQKVKESLYLFLLQKREENELSQAFTAYNTRVVTPPDGSMLPTAPVKKNILLVAFFLGLLLPVLAVFLIENLNTKIRGRKDLENLSLPFIGEIPFYSSEGKKWKLPRKAGSDVMSIVVKEGNRNSVNEAFRVLRSNIDFMAGKDNKQNIFVVTSFNPGSGKSFLAVNLAVCFALRKKRVLVIDGDLRHGSASAYVNSPSKGLSDYLSGRVDRWQDVVVVGEKYQSLNFIPVGTVPPNPTELLEDGRFGSMLEELRPLYDYIFVDCPPVDIVADTQIIGKLSDRTIFVIRAGLLEKSMLGELESIYNEKKYKNLSLVLNGTESSTGRYSYNYRYSYHYGYNSYY